jgi:hypothetical protein
MKERELFTKLNSLRSINADQTWLTSNREILMQQVYNGEEAKQLTTLAQLNLVLSRVFAPAYVAIMIVIFFGASGAFGWYGSANAQPGDSLYVAKIAKEKAQMTVTFDAQSKAKLNLEFAQNRLQELNQVIAQTDNVIDGDNSQRDTKVAQLKDNIKKEINNAKQRLDLTVDEDKSDQNNVENNDEGQFFAAGTGKTDEEVQISVPDSAGIRINKSAQILNEAEQLLDSDNFAAVADKLTQAEGAINEQTDDSKANNIKDEQSQAVTPSAAVKPAEDGSKAQ